MELFVNGHRQFARKLQKQTLDKPEEARQNFVAAMVEWLPTNQEMYKVTNSCCSAYALVCVATTVALLKSL